jgi:hypothetical protein
MATGVSEEEAKTDLCRAMADGKINFRVRIAENDDRFRGRVFARPNVEIPLQLSPDDLDWSRSRPLKPWAIGPVGPQRYVWMGGWEKRPIDLVKVSTSDVSRILCGGDEGTGARRMARTTVNQETNAIHALASHLRENPDLKREEAASWCKKRGFTLSARGFQARVWPAARQEAGLPRRASPGRKNKSSR